jgi:uncharacterized protein
VRLNPFLFAALITLFCTSTVLADSSSTTATTSSNSGTTATADATTSTSSSTAGTTTKLPEPQMSAGKRAAIMELLKITDADKKVDQVVSQMMAAHQRQYPLMLAQIVNSDSSLTDAQKKDIINKAQERSARSSERLKELFLQKIDLGKIMDQVALVIYDKNFTEPELRDIIAFYKTPTGQKSLKNMPEVMRESMDLTANLIAPQMGQIITQLMQEEKARIKTADK